MSAVNGTASKLLADALVDAAHHSNCIADLLQIQSSDDVTPWCLCCSDSEDCWAWNAMDLVTRQEVIEANRRYEMRRCRKWVRTYGGWPTSRIDVVKISKEVGAAPSCGTLD